MPDPDPSATPLEPPPNPWLARVPELEEGRRFPSMPPEAAAKLFEDMLTAGPKAITGIIDTLKEVDDGTDWKSRFLLRALVTHLGTPDRGDDRNKVEAIYAMALGDDRPDAVKTFLCQQLQYVAGASSIEALAAQFDTADLPLLHAAAAALTAIGAPARKRLAELAAEHKGPNRTAAEHALLQIRPA